MTARDASLPCTDAKPHPTTAALTPTRSSHHSSLPPATRNCGRGRATNIEPPESRTSGIEAMRHTTPQPGRADPRRRCRSAPPSSSPASSSCGAARRRRSRGPRTTRTLPQSRHGSPATARRCFGTRGPTAKPAHRTPTTSSILVKRWARRTACVCVSGGGLPPPRAATQRLQCQRMHGTAQRSTGREA